MKIDLAELDCFYISYDEPNCEQNWSDLLTKAPWAKRVHGVKGFDSAHKACAQQSETEYLITVDGDNIVDKKFFELTLQLPEHLYDSVLSWNSTNIINNLHYGNGGLKIWPRRFIMEMRSHENALKGSTHEVDFCWDSKYIQLHNIFSLTVVNKTPYQAFRAGFREGVKMTLDRGQIIDPEVLVSKMHPSNLKRLRIWGSVGADIENGLWAIFGTRMGVHYANIENKDITIVRDYEKMNMFFEQFERYTRQQLIQHSIELGEKIARNLNINFVDLNDQQSEFVKQLTPPPSNYSNPLITEIETFNNV